MKIVLYYIAFIVAYTILTATTGIFFLTWGAKRTLLEKAYVFFIGSPFNGSYSMWYIPVNGIVWATVFYLIKISFDKASAALKT